MEGKTGVWVGERKIASLGVGVRRWISMHGFAINICGDLSAFNHITPCGLPGVTMTSLEAEGASGVTVESCAREVAEIFNELLQSGIEKDQIWNSGNQEQKKILK
jgi:lipoate-protein ligase B